MSFEERHSDIRRQMRKVLSSAFSGSGSCENRQGNLGPDLLPYLY